MEIERKKSFFLYGNRLPGVLSVIGLCTEKSWLRWSSIRTTTLKTTKQQQNNTTTNSTGKNPSWELSVPQLIKNYLHISESECSWSWSKEPAICLIPSQRNPVHTLPSSCVKIYPNIIFWYMPTSSKKAFFPLFCPNKILHAFLFSPSHVPFSANIILI